jgi:hypothetical protein
MRIHLKAKARTAAWWSLPRSRGDEMSNTVQCSTHGESQKSFVCTHLTSEAAGLGFNRDEPRADNPFPDAWCDDCEIVRAAHGGWNEESEKLTKITLLCSGCYERSRIRNTRTTVTLDDLAGLRWKCGGCDEWHLGPCLDFGYAAPFYWMKEYHAANRESTLPPTWNQEQAKTFLNENYCSIEDRDFFVRGVIHVPIVGSTETLRWGVWGSLSRGNFERLVRMDDDPRHVELPAMFSWLNNRISEYPDTLNLKMYAHIQKPNCRPHFELESTVHRLSQEYHHGITAERVREIMLRRLPNCEDLSS